MPTLIFWTWCY